MNKERKIALVGSPEGALTAMAALMAGAGVSGLLPSPSLDSTFPAYERRQQELRRNAAANEVGRQQVRREARKMAEDRLREMDAPRRERRKVAKMIAKRTARRKP